MDISSSVIYIVCFVLFILTEDVYTKDPIPCNIKGLIDRQYLTCSFDWDRDSNSPSRQSLFSLRECYSCDSRGSYASSSACSAEDPVTQKLNRIKVPNEEECFLCAKIITDVAAVTRGCISQTKWEEIAEYFLSNGACSQNVPRTSKRDYMEYCVCEQSRCNHSEKYQPSTLVCIVVSLMTLFYFVLSN